MPINSRLLHTTHSRLFCPFPPWMQLTLRTTPMATLDKNRVCTMWCGGSNGRQGMGMWRNGSSIGGGPIASHYN
ncbi:hypothetical protein ARMGADRAFT_438763 [Armillaria gallica]|uniref:Uncharacterized protein n=1 Tax=Armillaria gallica TaxID=47427 RepID=A0A2H3DFX1_ARMGA|nr:hypothetical protein ARMGADRAFT_438763 [Armillaria gallica]